MSDTGATWRDLVREYFPAASDADADNILWEHTPFPMGGEGYVRAALQRLKTKEKAMADIDPAAKEQLHTLIEQIPNDGEWWSSSGQETFNELGVRLLAHGFDPQEASDFLGSAYGAVAGEFGS